MGSKKAKKRDFPILTFTGHIIALSLAGEASAGLIWVDFTFLISQEAPTHWALNSRAVQANHGHPSMHALFQVQF